MAMTTDLSFTCGCPFCAAMREAGLDAVGDLGFGAGMPDGSVIDSYAFEIDAADFVRPQPPVARPGAPGWPFPRGGSSGTTVIGEPPRQPPGPDDPPLPPRPDSPDPFGPLVANEAIFRWNIGQPLGTEVTLTYSFMQSLPSYLPVTSWPNFAPFTPTQKASAELALAHYTEIAGLTFVLTSDSGDGGKIRFGTIVTDPALIAFAYYGGTYSPIAGDVAVNRAVPGNADSVPGGLGNFALIHELGHALGLKHPFEVPFLPAEQDSQQFTVMAYAPHPHGVSYVVTGDTVTFIDAYPRTPMVLDIAAIQYLYGANGGAHSGNDLYRWQTNEVFIETIWDGGGIDTIDFSNQTRNAVIDLTPGSYSSLGRDTFQGLSPTVVAQLQGRTDLYGIDNLAIAFGTIIENAIGGGGNDSIFGNDAANDLQGGAGHDTLFGGSGNDTLAGGPGNDSLDGSAGTDTAVFQGALRAYQISQTGGTIVVSLPVLDGTDALTNIEFLQFADQTVPTTGLPPVAVSIVFTGSTVEGNAGAVGLVFTVSQNAVSIFDTVVTYGTVDGTAVAGADYVGVSRGTVTIPAGASSASFAIEVLGDSVIESDESFSINLLGASNQISARFGPISTTSVTIFDDELGPPILVTGLTLVDGPAPQLIEAGALADRLVGGGGDDTLCGRDGGDIVDGGGGRDLLYGDLGYGLDGDDRVLAGDGDDVAFGNGGRDTLYGGGGDDMLAGDGGDDQLLGAEGDDVLFGGAGADSLAGDAGDDRLSGGAGTDSLFGGSGDDRVEIDAADAIADGGAGSDMLVVGDNLGGPAAIDLGQAANQNVGASGPVLNGFEGVDASAASAALSIMGAAFDGIGNRLFGSAHDDSITGSGAADVIVGGAGNDALNGGGGDDIIIAGPGNDTVSGGAGADAFFFGADDGALRIADFAPGQDRLALPESLGFTAASALALAQQSGANAVLDLGGGQSITLAGITVAALAAADFLIA